MELKDPNLWTKLNLLFKLIVSGIGETEESWQHKAVSFPSFYWPFIYTVWQLFLHEGWIQY